MNDNVEYEQLIDDYVFLSKEDFKTKVNGFIMERLSTIKPNKLDEHTIKNHMQQIIDMKDSTLKNDDSDIVLESAIRISKAIDNLEVYNENDQLNEVAKQERDDVIHWALSDNVFFTYYKDDKDIVIKPGILSNQEAKVLLEFLKTVLN